MIVGHNNRGCLLLDCRPEQFSDPDNTGVETALIDSRDAQDMAAYLYQLDGPALEWLDQDLPIEENP